MAAELQADYFTGQTVYFLLRNAVGKIWNGASFVTYNSANYATYTIAGTEEGTSGYFTGAMPAVAAGIYSAVAKAQSGVSAAESDATVAVGNIEWDGTLVCSGVGALINSVTNIQDATAVNSLGTAVLKLTSKFDAKTGITYKTDGITAKMVQTPTTDPTMVPIRSLPVGV